jgi:transposase InsO family protein
VSTAAAAAGVSERTVWRWLRRWREEGEQGLLDRSCRPHRSPGQLPSRKVDAIRALRRLRMTAAQIAVIRSVMSDNGSAFVAQLYHRALDELGLKHLRTRPYRPRTNGKAERFIQTLLNEWAYERIYGSSAERTAALPLFLERYNLRRPHGSLGHKPPASRLRDLAGNYS